jgi:hypothetical protein
MDLTGTPGRYGSRRLAVALLAYGVAGVILFVAGLWLVARSPLGSAATAMDAQQHQISRTVEATRATLRDAAAGADGVDASLTATAESARRASALSTGLASSLRQLAAATDVDVFGSRPFAAFGAESLRVADEADSLSADLSTTAERLDRNRADAAAVAGDLRALETEVGTLAGLVSEGTGFGSLVALRAVVVLILAWLAVPSVAAIGGGLGLLRRRRPGRLIEGLSETAYPSPPTTGWSRH